MSKLKEIEDFIQQVADAFAAVLDYEICIVDDDLEVLVGTGKYQEEINDRGGPGCITHQLMLNPQQTDLFVRDTSESALCNQCSKRQGCPVQATIVCSIVFSNITFGTFCLMAMNERQSQNFIT
ncbi:hypothetical protein [Acetohalobium arabaticum]|uniref:Uncharacterized protein n=1 Tax=Acetohalobium arabaticum (strain ATCC 49924 / DSM 5501 / Z-7288) TaxID=574087 RepID=D9QS68_ACEAZ|nr:hypothetical protein [Acetohalobium arabaticum]ADL13359.1 hypothetical protein Acear_1856 [Acetohalobium arabaticum DSM 5501]